MTHPQTVLTIVATPILIRPEMFLALSQYVQACLAGYTTTPVITRVGRLDIRGDGSGGEDVVSLFLRTETPADLAGKIPAFIAGLHPLLSSPVELSVHDFRSGSVEHLCAGPDAAKRATFAAQCAVWRDRDELDEQWFMACDAPVGGDEPGTDEDLWTSQASTASTASTISNY